MDRVRATITDQLLKVQIFCMHHKNSFMAKILIHGDKGNLDVPELVDHKHYDSTYVRTVNQEI